MLNHPFLSIENHGVVDARPSDTGSGSDCISAKLKMLTRHMLESIFNNWIIESVIGVVSIAIRSTPKSWSVMKSSMACSR